MADETQEKQPVERIRYTVYAANIKDDNGKKRRHGDVVELSPKLARHYNELGYLRPFIPDADDDEDDEVVSHARTTPAQRRATEEHKPAPRSNRTTQL